MTALLTNTCTPTYVPTSENHLNICSGAHCCTHTDMQEATATITAPPQALTCPPHLSIFQAVMPGVNHLPRWPTITACSLSDRRPPLLDSSLNSSPQPLFTWPPSKVLSAAASTTPTFMDSHRSITESTPCTFSPSFSPLPSLFRPLSNYSWYLAWVTVFNKVFKNKRALLKGWQWSDAPKGSAFGAARWGSVFLLWLPLAGRVVSGWC